MFADRIREDKAFGAARPGLFDALFTRWRDRRFLRTAAEAATRFFSPGQSLFFRLGQGKYLALTGVRLCRVRCVRGAVWVTATGDGRDRVLTPGQSLTLARSGKVVITGRGETADVAVRWA